MNKILHKLKGGDLRSIGRAEEVVQDILKNSSLFGEVFEGILNDDPVVRMRSADALEKVSSRHPEYLQPYKDRLINEVSNIEQQEVRWHVAQMFSYLSVSKEERDKIMKILASWINSEKSQIVKVNSIQTLSDFAERDEKIGPGIVEKLEELVKTGSPAIRSRGKKLIDRLKRVKTPWARVGGLRTARTYDKQIS